MWLDVYVRMDKAEKWRHIALTEAKEQAQTIEDTWIMRGYETKIVNRLTGRRIRCDGGN